VEKAHIETKRFGSQALPCWDYFRLARREYLGVITILGAVLASVLPSTAGNSPRGDTNLGA